MAKWTQNKGDSISARPNDRAATHDSLPGHEHVTLCTAHFPQLSSRTRGRGHSAAGRECNIRWRQHAVLFLTSSSTTAQYGAIVLSLHCAWLAPRPREHKWVRSWLFTYFLKILLAYNNDERNPFESFIDFTHWPNLTSKIFMVEFAH